MNRSNSRRLVRFLLASVVCLTSALQMSQTLAAPTIKGAAIRGLQIGATTTIAIDGAELAADSRVVLPFPIAKQVVKPGAKPERIEVEITLPADVRPGIYPLRIANAAGMSNALLVGVDAMPQIPAVAKLETLPVALHGKVSGPVVFKTEIQGKAGQRLVVDVEARRIGSEFSPVVSLFGPRRVQIAWAQLQNPLAGDARLVATLPVDGLYEIELHDAEFKGGPQNHYRMKIGDLQFADLVHPMGATRGGKASLELTSTSQPGVKVETDLTQAIADMPATLPAGVFSGAAPRVFVTDLPEVTETAAEAGKLQDIPEAPVVINGRLDKKGEQDRFRLAVKPGQVLRFDVIAQRAGSRLDGVLVLQNEQGGQLAENDDRPPTADPGLDFTVPAGMNHLVVAMRDRVLAGGPEFVYRIVITPTNRPDFSLTLMSPAVYVPQNGTALVRVRANRMGYAGPIKLSIPGLPAGVALAGDEIPPGANDSLLSLTSPAGSATDQQVLGIVGQGTDANQQPIVRTAQAAAGSPNSAALPPWIAREFALSLTAPSLLRVEWDGTDTNLPIGYRYPAKVKVARAEGATGAVRLSLLTTQTVPKKKEGNNEVDDVAKALRIEGAAQIAADQSAAAPAVLVPGDLPAIPYDIAIQAELLSADGKNVLATAVTPSRRMIPSSPLRLALSGAAKVEAKAGGGATGKLTGQVIRSEGFNSPLTVTLEGLPAELPPPEVEIAGDKNEFALDVAFPFGSKLEALKGVKLVGRSTNGGLDLKTNLIDVELTLVAGDAPPPPPALHKVFEDESYFVSLLNEGKGKGSLERADRYSGKASLKVTPDQRLRAKMPNWGYKITEKPGEGEFRYLRFAWKKRGGNNILLQLAGADGKFGPTQGQQGPPLRYEAGADNPFRALAVKIDKAVPAKWEVVTRDLFADFGEFKLDGLAFTATDGQEAFFDHVYLARSMDDFKGCPEPLPAEAPLVVFEDQPEFVAELKEGSGQATLDTSDRYSGTASVKVTPDQRYNAALPGLGVKIRENPGPGEYRYLRFAWKKQGGQAICIQLNHDGAWGPAGGNPAKFRYHAGPGPECYGASVPVDPKLPGNFVLVTRDLFADFGEFTFTGLALSPVDGEAARYDHIYLGKSLRDFELVAPKK